MLFLPFSLPFMSVRPPGLRTRVRERGKRKPSLPRREIFRRLHVPDGRELPSTCLLPHESSLKSLHSSDISTTRNLYKTIYKYRDILKCFTNGFRIRVKVATVGGRYPFGPVYRYRLPLVKYHQTKWGQNMSQYHKVVSNPRLLPVVLLGSYLLSIFLRKIEHQDFLSSDGVSRCVPEDGSLFHYGSTLTSSTE